MRRGHCNCRHAVSHELVCGDEPDPDGPIDQQREPPDRSYRRTSVTGVADNAGNTYTHLTAADAHDTFSMFSSIWYCANANSGGTTLTFTGSTATRNIFGRTLTATLSFTGSQTRSGGKALTGVLHAGLGGVPARADLVFYVESDLRWTPETVLALIRQVGGEVSIVAPLILQGDRFYETSQLKPGAPLFTGVAAPVFRLVVPERKDTE